MATRGRTPYKAVAHPRSSSVTSPNKNTYTMLSRQIGDHKWWAGVAYLEQQPDMKEVTVAEHYMGWRYVLARTKNIKTFVKLTYYNNTMWSIELMRIPCSNYAPAPFLMGYCGASVLGTWQAAPLARCASC